MNGEETSCLRSVLVYLKNNSLPSDIANTRKGLYNIFNTLSVVKRKNNMRTYLCNFVLLMMGTLFFTACSNLNGKTNIKTMDDFSQTEGLEVATLGAGCFWCVEAVFQELKGVQSVVSGYTGGHVVSPTYRQITTGQTGHAEVAQITFDPKVISFEEILEVFWTTHDPTTLNRQGADVGTQYRSAVFYHTETQKTIADSSKANVATQLWDDAITTEISALGTFYPAEEYHQNYYTDNPNYGYCVAVINPKMAKFRKRFKDKLKEQL